MRWVKTAMAITFTLGLLLVAAGKAGMLSGTAPSNLGVHNDQLAPPALTPNSVSSQAKLHSDNPQRQSTYIEPLGFKGDPNAAMARLTGILSQTPHIRIIEQKADYVYAQANTPLLKFTDDVEFWLDSDAGVIQMRSASRLGYSDLGANRKRLEDIRSRFGR